MPSDVITREIASLLIARDQNWQRFQRFCVDLMSKAEGVDYVTSALSHDLGRDGRTPLISTASLEAVVCSSVKETPVKAVKKAKADLKRLVETGAPRRAAFCYTCELQERHKEEIIQYARSIASFRVRAEGVEFLALASTRHPEVFEEHYRGELLSLRHGLLAGQTNLAGSANGLRIAMATQFGEDARELRLEAMANLIRLSLLEKGNINVVQLHDHVSAVLGLSQPVNSAYLNAAIDRLVDEREVLSAAGAIRLSTSGVATAEEIITEARHRLLNGRQTFRDDVATRLSEPPDDQEFDHIWMRLQDGLADLFMRDGMTVVRAILHPITENDVHTSDESAMWATLVETILPNSMRRDRSLLVSKAVLAVLIGDSSTRAWLSQVAATFVSICALGLHPEAQEELLNRLRNWAVLVDTHVAISFLCAGECDHDGVLRVISAWQKLRREVATCSAVLEEAAYHAWVAAREYEDWWRQLHSLGPEAANELISNAFLRSFYHLSKDGYDPRRWKAFIENYRGQSEFDCDNLKKLFLQMGWRVLDDTHVSQNVIQEVRHELERVTHSSNPFLRRPEWDARTAYAAIQHKRKHAEKGGNIIVVTKSRAIRIAVDWFEKNSMGTICVMNVSALGYAMALTPGLSVSLVDIRELLFDRGVLSKAFMKLDSKARRLADQDKEDGLDLVARPQLELRLRTAVTEELRMMDKENPS